MSAAEQLLSASCDQQPSRSASGVAVKVAKGFHVFRVDGYSRTKALTGGQRLSSQPFLVGGSIWCIDVYPNGADGSVDDSGDIGLYLRLYSRSGYYNKERVRAQYKFGLLDADGNDVDDRSPETSVFTCTSVQPRYALPGHVVPSHIGGEPEGLGCGYPAFITREELERRRESLLPDDCLAVRCDVAVVEVEALVDVAPKEHYSNYMARYGPPPDARELRLDYGDDYSDWEGTRERKRPHPPLDDREFVRQCRAKNRR
ncbi:hypothetical protein ACP70R_003036 [Stipagrostis hirtigluma subsp. patula]